MNRLLLFPDVRPATTPRLDVLCFRPDGRRFAAFERRLRQAVASLGDSARLSILPAASAQLPAAGVYLSPRWPTTLMFVDGHLMGQAAGDLPLHEIRSLVTSALHNGASTFRPT